MLNFSFEAKGQTVHFSIDINDTAAPVSVVSNYPVWVQFGFPLDTSWMAVTDNNGNYRDSISNPPAILPITFTTYDCMGIIRSKNRTIVQTSTFLQDTLFLSCFNPGPNLTVSANANQSIPSPLQYNFFGSFSDTALPSDTEYTFHWDFGDGQSSVGNVNPSHTYLTAGVFNACFTVSAKDTANDLLLFRKTDCVTVMPNVSNACTTYFSIGNSPPSLTFNFADSNSIFVAGSRTFGWDYGDGSVDTGFIVNHTYATAGVYSVCHWVEVRDSFNALLCSDTICRTITAGVLGTCTSGFRVANQPQSPTFTFTDTSTVTSPGQITSHWDFGDGTIDTGFVITHTYIFPNTYNVRHWVEVRDVLGSLLCSDTTFRSITSNTPNFTSNANFTLLIDSIVANGTVVRFDGSLSTAGSANGSSFTISYLWDFGDGNTGVGLNTQHTYAPLDSVYVVCLFLTVSDTSLTVVSRDTVCRTANIPGPFCSAEYIIDTANSFFGNVVIWNNSKPSLSLGTYVTSYSWDFGDGDTSNQAFPSHTYANPGLYDVCLTVTSKDSLNGICVDMYCDSLGADSLGNLIYKTAAGFTLNVFDANAVSLNEPLIQEFAIYPNPTNDRLNLAWKEPVSGIIDWKIFDLKGAMLNQGFIKAKGKNRVELDVNNLEPGLYILSTTHDDKLVGNYKLWIY